MKNLILSTILLLTTIISAQDYVGRSKTFNGSELNYTSITVNAGIPQVGSSIKGEGYFVMISEYKGQNLIAYVENPNLFTCELTKILIDPNQEVILYGRFKGKNVFIFDKIEVKTVKINLTK